MIVKEFCSVANQIKLGFRVKETKEKREKKEKEKNENEKWKEK